MEEIKKKQIFDSTLKGLVGGIPYAGAALNEVIFEYRSQVKQRRINNFIELLKEYFEKVDEKDIDFEHLKSEEFGDIFESILKRIALNNSEKKLVRFKNILLSHFYNEFEYVEQTENFLDLIGRISEIEISILKFHDGLKEDFSKVTSNTTKLHSEISQNENKLRKEKELLKKGHANNYSKFENLLKEQKKELSESEALLIDYQMRRKAEYYNLSENQYKILINSLYSKGLLYDAGHGYVNYEPFRTLGITNYGIEFLEFIKERKN